MLQLKNLLQNKTYVFADQALVSLLNFGSVFLLSKLTSVPIFANFVLAYGYSNLIFILITYFLSAPILVFLPKKDEKETSSYLISLLGLNILFSVLLSFLSFPLIQSQVDSLSFWSFLGINFGMILYELFKKFIFAQRKLNFVYVVISSVLLVVLFFGIIWNFKNSLNLQIILGAYTISFTLAAIFLFIVIGLKKLFSWHSFYLTTKNLKTIILYLREHYIYSKWIIIAGILFWSYSQGVFIIADILEVSDLDIAKVRTIQNLLGLFTILLMSMESYFIPLFSKKVDQLPQVVKDFYSKYSLKLGILFVISIPVFYIVYELFYYEKYGNGIYIIAILWLSQMFVTFTRPLSMALRAKEISYPLFIAHFIALIGLILLGLLFMYLWKDIGISLALFLAYFLSNTTILYYFRKHIT